MAGALITAAAGEFQPAIADGGKLAGLDIGTKTIGLAICDAGWHFAGPSETIKRTKFTADLELLKAFVTREHVVGLVVGLPLNMDGTDSPRTQSVRAFARNLAPLDLPILLWDERWSTRAVERAMIDADVSRAKRAEKVDALAAAHILQGAIDALANLEFPQLSGWLVDLLSIDSLSDAEIEDILESGARWLTELRAGQISRRPLQDKIVFNLFYENSTRTAMSFATAAARLGAQPISLSVEHSSVKKGETLEDTARTLNAMRPDALVIRHRDNGAPGVVAGIMDAPVINAGDGTNEHPTQSLLDALTMRNHFGRLQGLKVAICGDIRHSRVARSNAKLLSRLGAEIRLCGPADLLPDDGTATDNIDAAVGGADVVMMLRVQRERLDDDLGDAPGEYLQRFGLTAQRLALASPDAIVMHPGPINRGVEIDGFIADNPERSVIALQVEAGVAIRMACLEMLTRSA